jgi:hypothetical protein
MIAEPPVSLVTAAEIALRLGQPLRRVQWVLATRPHIRPAALAGTVRVYSTVAIAQVQDEIDRMDERRKGAGDE